MKKGCFWAFLVVAVLLGRNVSANFACGEVGGIGNFSSSWFIVQVYYSQNSSEKTTCEVSPDDGKYCCDPLQIKSVGWQIGKVLNAKIVQNEYFAASVNLTISGEGYDVFPKMDLRRGIELSNFTRVNINATRIEINVSTVSDYKNISYLLRNLAGQKVLEGKLCPNCNDANLVLENFSYGQFELEVIARNPSGNELVEKENFWNFKYINFERKLKCRKCRDNYVYSGEKVNVSLIFNFSHEIDWKINDAFPNSWLYLGNDTVEWVSDTHKIISWNVNGKNIEKTYEILAPKTIFTKKFIFNTIFEDYNKSSSVILYRMYRFWPYPSRYLLNRPSSNYFTSFERVSPSEAAVVDFSDDFLTMVVLFPTIEINDVYLFVNKNPPIKKSRAKYNFVVGSNIDDVDEVWIKYKIPKRVNREIQNSGIFYYNEQGENWIELENDKQSEDAEYEYYESYAEKEGFFAIDFDYGKTNE